MSFHFPLEILLRVRKLLEEIRQAELVQARAAVARSQQKLDAASEFRLRSRQEIARALHDTIPAAELRFAASSISCVVEAEKHERNHLQELVKSADAARAQFVAQRQDREVVESLRENQLNNYVQEQSRQEQRELDQLALLLRGTPGQRSTR